MHGFRYVNAKPINLETILLFLGNPGNLTISLYWTEYLDSILRDSLSDFGIQIVNSGYRGNGPFEKPSADIGGRSIYLLNVFKHICSHNKIICDEASTAFWYALSISKTIYLANSIQEIRGIGSDKSFYSYNNRDLIESLKIKYEVISKDFLMIPPVAENVEIAKTLLGFGIDLSRAKKDIPTLHNIEVDNSGLERVKSKLKSKMN
jgi:hypothetical protein